MAGTAYGSSQWVIDIDGQPRTMGNAQKKATVIVFLGTQCPISNRSIPILNDLAKSHSADPVDFFAVVSDPTISRKDAADYRDSYKIGFPVIFDAAGTIAAQLHPTVTPDAFVLDQTGTLRYSGRIDDSFAALGKVNQVVKAHDLNDAIIALLNDQPIANPKTEAIGCEFEAWNKPSLSNQVTYARDIAPIMNANCVSCHRSGQIAPFPLGSYNDVAKRAKQISDVTATHYMPPWKPAPNFGSFVGEHRLPDHDIELIKTWATNGAPQGDLADLPPPPKFTDGWQLGKPDLVVTMPDVFTIPAGGPDIYRVFVVPMNLSDDTYVAGVEFKPGAPTVVHHSLFFLDDTGVARKLDAADPGPGYRSFGGIGFTPTGGLGGWAPGASPGLLPDGVARFVHKGSDLCIQMHYHPDGKEHIDQSSIAIYFQKKPVKKILSAFPVGTRDIDIAPGDADFQRTITFTLPIDVTLSGVIPHMHLLGRDMKAAATAPDGKEIPLVWIPDWDFKWQGQYRYTNPITLPAGTTLTLTAKYDNSANNPDNPNSPPKRVVRGEQTTDEMCVCFFEFLADSQDQANVMRKQIVRSLIASQIAQKLAGNKS
jgi:thiol-disulfide isomerase/thioredoxin